MLEASRDYSFCNLSANPAYISAGQSWYCGGSSTSAEGRIRCSRPNRRRPACSTATCPGNQFVGGVPLFNFAPYNYFQRPDERYTFGTFAEYEISPGAKPYLEAMFMHDHTDAQIAPSGNFNNTSYLNCDNPLLSAQELSTICVAGQYVHQAGVVNPTTGLPSPLAIVLHRPP